MKNLFNKIRDFIISRKEIIIYSFVFFVLRSLFLDKYFYLRDERDLMLTSFSLARTGKDLYGNIFPLVFERISPQTPLLGMYWTIPFIKTYNISSPLMEKFLYILPSLFFPLLTFELMFVVTKKKVESMLGAFVITFSPWFFHIGRLGIEAHIAYFFCLVGLILYFHQKKLLGFLFLVVSFFFYQGIRPFIFIIIPFYELWNYFNNKKRFTLRNTLITVILFICALGGVFLGSNHIENSASRSKAEIIFLNNEKLTLETNFLRQISNAPFSVRKYFDNKVSLISDSIFQNMFKGLDFSYLFSTGDYVGIYSNGVTGQFFPFLFLFFVIGIYFVAKKRSADYYFMVSLIFIGMIGSVINSYSLTFSIRSIFSLLGIGFVIACGISGLYEMVSTKYKYSVILGISFLYVSFSVVFIYKYMFQNYNLINDSFNEHERIIASFLDKNKVKKLMVTNSHTYLLSYASTNKLVKTSTIQELQQSLKSTKDTYKFNGHLFKQCYPQKFDIEIHPFPISTVIEDSCLTLTSRLYLETLKSDKVVKISSPTYTNLDFNRSTKYYFFR